MERVKQITSKDGKHRLAIDVNDVGLYRYVAFDDRYRSDPDFQSPPEFTIVEFSGLYETVEATESDAMTKFAWLRD